MNASQTELQLLVALAKHKEASARADDTIDSQRETIGAQNHALETQREIIDLLHAQIRRMERQMEELRAAL